MFKRLNFFCMAIALAAGLAAAQDKQLTQTQQDRQGVMGSSIKKPYSDSARPGFQITASKIWGCDISKWQGDVNFTQLNTAVSFTVIRASYGTSGLDDKLAQNRSRAEAVGMEIGFYHFAYPDLGNSAEAEAQNFCDRIGTLKPGQFVVLDYERSWTGDVVGWCKTWMDYVSTHLGAKPLIYLNLSTINAYSWTSIINADYGLWLARWDYDKNAAAPATAWPFVAMRQYSDSETFAGISGSVDGDVFYGTLDQLKQYGYQPAAQWQGALSAPVSSGTAAPTQSISGWAKDAGGNYAVDKVSVYVGSAYIKDISYGSYSSAGGGNYGFSGSVDLSSYIGQTVNITVRAASGSKTYDLTASSVTVVPNPPSAPTSLAKTASAATTVSLSWTDNSSNETGFKIKRNGAVVATVSANTAAYTDTGLTPSTAYTYTVCATNAGGDSADSNSVAVTTDALISESLTLSCRTISIGESATISVTITNTGVGTASSVVVNMVQLGAAKAADVPWTIGDMAGGATSTKSFTFAGGFGSGKAAILSVNVTVGTKKLRLRVKATPSFSI